MTAKEKGTMIKETTEPAVSWNEYALIAPGQYPAYCRKATWYEYRPYKRWTCLLLFDILADNLVDSLGTIPLWFNGGSKAKPSTSLLSRYLAAWVIANGGPPVRHDRLSPKVFTGRAAIVVVDTLKSVVVCSVVRRILSWETRKSGSDSQPVMQSRLRTAKRRGIKEIEPVLGNPDSALPLGRGAATRPAHAKAGGGNAARKGPEPGHTGYVDDLYDPMQEAAAQDYADELRCELIEA